MYAQLLVADADETASSREGRVYVSRQRRKTGNRGGFASWEELEREW